MEIAFRDATLEDIPTLAKMNRQLIEAEQSRNPMSLDELEERMRGFLRPKTQSPHGWSVVLILVDGQVAGYTVYRLGRDEYNASQPEVPETRDRQGCLRTARRRPVLRKH